MKALILILLVACGGPNMTAVRAAHYDADRAVVFQLAREAVAAQRTIASEDAAGFRTGFEDIEIIDTRRKKTKYRAQFAIAIVGERPWQIEVRGLVEGEPETAPMPSWLGPPVDRLRASIHDKLKPYAR